MCTIAEMARRARAINLTDITGSVAGENTEEMKRLNLKQMMAGKNNKGELFSPRHSENPFFKKPGAGLRYAAWKHRLFPETPFDIANLRINGFYQDSVYVLRSGNKIEFNASASFAGSIDKTFGNTPLGLNPDSKVDLWTNTLRSPIVQDIASKLGVKTITG